MANYSASEIANWFLGFNQYIESISDSDGISNLKLQKLLYYAQGFHLALLNKPLFDESIEAWDHGPVVPEVYHKYKSFGSSPIISNVEFDLNSIDLETQKLLELVYDTFAIYSAWGLRNLTHQESPWIEARESGSSLITQETIKTFFDENYQDYLLEDD